MKTTESVTFVVSRLGCGDIASFRELNLIFSEVFEDTANYQSRPPSDNYLNGLLAKQHIIALVARVDGRIEGGLVAYVLDKFEQERSEVYIYDLAVREKFRRRGIARNLIFELRKIAHEAGAWVIYVQADKAEEDLPAQKLYESLGKREDVFHYDIAVN